MNIYEIVIRSIFIQFYRNHFEAILLNLVSNEMVMKKIHTQQQKKKMANQRIYLTTAEILLELKANKKIKIEFLKMSFKRNLFINVNILFTHIIVKIIIFLIVTKLKFD